MELLRETLGGTTGCHSTCVGEEGGGDSGVMAKNRNVFRALGTVSLALAAIGSTLAVGASCIIHDDNIIILRDGYQWCANAEGALGWQEGENPALGDPVVDSEGHVILGCTCFENEEHEKFEDWVDNGFPSSGDADYDDYVILRDEILHVVREACIAEADASGFDFNNCLDVVPDDDLVFSNGNKGECKYEELVSSDTDGGTGTDSDGPPVPPFDLSGLVCGGDSCRAPQSLIDDMLDRPEAFLLDSTRITFDEKGALYFSDVSPGDAAYVAGLRSKDKLLEINGEEALTLEQVSDLLLSLRGKTQATLKIRDVYKNERTLSISVY